ncbi:MAG: SAM-dependent methyltransferase [Gammaproteobacteria bacterium]|nr:SAM-dependent methyltransferase [Gammaproteobacteria bacterium]
MQSSCEISSNSIRKFRPEVFKAPRDFVQPIFADQPIVLEIGAGVGLHALSFARENPDFQVFAVERTAEKFQKFHQSFLSERSQNLTPIHADAIPWVVHALPPACLQQVFILYPNPEPKNPAQRWFNMPFMQFLLSRMKPNATLTLASNITEYLDEAEQQLINLWQLPYQCSAVTTERRTHFEIKYMERGEACGQLLVTKPAGFETLFDTFSPESLRLASLGNSV